MKRTIQIVLAVLALAPSAYAHELVVPRVPLNPAYIPTINLPSKSIPGPFEKNRPLIKFPTAPQIVPALPIPIYVAPAEIVKPQRPAVQSPVPAMPKVLAAAAKSEEGIKQNELDTSFDNAQTQKDGSVIVVIEAPKKQQKRNGSRHMLPESELELEIGIIQ